MESDDQDTPPKDPVLVLSVPANPRLSARIEEDLTKADTKTFDLAEKCAKDPVIMLELIKAATYAIQVESGVLPNPQHVLSSIKREDLRSIIAEIRARRPHITGEVTAALEEASIACFRLSQVALGLGLAVGSPAAETVYMAALFKRFGDLLAILRFQEEYVTAKVANAERAKLAHRLLKDHEFDLEQEGVRYLRDHGLPELFLSYLDHESPSDKSAIVTGRNIILAAAELLTAFEEHQLDKYEPGKTLPARSPLRPLHIDDTTYAAAFREISTFLNSATRLLDEVEAEEVETRKPRPQKARAEAPPNKVLKLSSKEVTPSAARMARISQMQERSAQSAPPPHEHKASPDLTWKEARRSLDVIGRPSPLIVAANRGIRNACDIFSRAQETTLRSVIRQLVAPITRGSPPFERALVHAASVYYPDAFDIVAENDELAGALIVLSPGEILAILSMTYLCRIMDHTTKAREIGKRLLRRLTLHTELGRIAGQHVPGTGPGPGMLLAGLRYLGAGLLFVSDPEGFEEYMEHLDQNRLLFDSAWEREHWNHDHLNVAALCVQSLGLGIQISHALSSLESASAVSEPSIRSCCALLHFVERLHMEEEGALTADALSEAGIPVEELDELAEKYKVVRKMKDWCEWLEEALPLHKEQ